LRAESCLGAPASIEFATSLRLQYRAMAGLFYDFSKKASDCFPWFRLCGWLLVLAGLPLCTPDELTVGGFADPGQSFAEGAGLYEGQIGLPTRFTVLAQDIYGSKVPKCNVDTFEVQVQPRHVAGAPGSECRYLGNCSKCWQTTACLVECTDGRYTYEYVTEMAGFMELRVLCVNAKTGEWQDIVNSPARPHVEDGGVLLPGFTFVGYLGIFVFCILSAAVTVAILFSIALKHHKLMPKPLTEDEREMATLQELSQQLERQQLLAQHEHPRLLEDPGDDEESGGSRPTPVKHLIEHISSQL